MQHTDQLQRTITLVQPLRSIISLVPSQTELLFDLGLEDEVTGITKFCIHPDKWFRSKTRVGGTKQLNIELIEKINPDLIIGNKEENQQDQLEILMQKYPVWVSDIKTLDDAIAMIHAVGEMTSKKSAAKNIVSNIISEFNNLSKSYSELKKRKAAYLIWNDPIMCAGADTFVNEMMHYCHFENVLEKYNRYPTITLETLKSLQPEYILLSSEPFPFTEVHRNFFQNYFQESKVILVDGEYFSWYGSRLINAPRYFNTLPLKSDS